MESAPFRGPRHNSSPLAGRPLVHYMSRSKFGIIMRLIHPAPNGIPNFFDVGNLPVDKKKDKWLSFGVVRGLDVSVPLLAYKVTVLPVPIVREINDVFACLIKAFGSSSKEDQR